jgi:transposase-like protein
MAATTPRLLDQGEGSSVSAAVQIVEDRALEELAATYDQEHNLELQAGASCLDHVICAGKALLESKKYVPHGQWVKWLLARFPDRSYMTHYQYMRIAREEATVRASGATTLAFALREVRGTLQPADVRVGTAVRDQARAMYQTGAYTLAEVAAELGVSPSTVGNWTNPKAYERQKRISSQRTKKAQRALRRQEDERMVRNVGGQIAQAYSLARKSLQALQEAHDRLDLKPEVRVEVRQAMSYLYATEDAIVKASKLS